MTFILKIQTDEKKSFESTNLSHEIFSTYTEQNFNSNHK